MYELNQKNKMYPENALVICESNDDIFYFNVSMKVEEDEYPIYSLNTNKRYANDFIEFLKKRITES